MALVSSRAERAGRAAPVFAYGGEDLMALDCYNQVEVITAKHILG